MLLSIFHPVDAAIVSEKVNAGVSQATLFQEEIPKATQKIPVVTGEVLNISLKDFAALVIEEGAPYSFKRWVCCVCLMRTVFSECKF